VGLSDSLSLRFWYASGFQLTCEGIDPSSAQPFGAQLKLMRRISLKNGQPYMLLLSSADEAVFTDSLLMGT
jgi:hypothetical protein